VKVVTRREPKFTLIEVVDQGPGILPEETVRIFELFGQGVRGLDRRTGGLGIGLHLVRRISELHGAHVGVNSQPGQGSTFWVRLPASLAEDAARDAAGEPVAEPVAGAIGLPEPAAKRRSRGGAPRAVRRFLRPSQCAQQALACSRLIGRLKGEHGRIVNADARGPGLGRRVVKPRAIARGGLSFALAAPVYLATMNRTIGFVDRGELAAVATRRRH
jgi:hypothetical protein